jgi:hypothetical protein
LNFWKFLFFPHEQHSTTSKYQGRKYLINQLPVEEAIARVRRFENQLTPEEFKLYRAEFLRKHRTKNILLGGAIMSGVIGVCKGCY